MSATDPIALLERACALLDQALAELVRLGSPQVDDLTAQRMDLAKQAGIPESLLQK